MTLSRTLLFLAVSLGTLPHPAVIAQEALPGAHTLAVPDGGWKLWPDTAASWKDDTLYLPDEVDLKTLPVHPPTGGWQALDSNGIAVTLPGTVEEHFWGKLGNLRPYTSNEYGYSTSDPEIKLGNYEGVSWWWRSVDIPADFQGKTVLLHLRGVRQRAEIFVNHRLVGYDLIAETAFDTDISSAIVAGRPNQIAIRITNPGGRLDWRDNVQQWGKYTLQKSPGFGGMDRGVTITAHDAVYLSDAWALNTADPRTIHANTTLRNTTAQPITGSVAFSVIDLKTGAELAGGKVPATVAANSSAEVSLPLTAALARMWSLDSPSLYGLRAVFTAGSGAFTDTRTVRFGFRSVEVRGVGKDAGLYLNGQRIRIYTAISWGFWGLNGLWPTPELAKKEVVSAKSLGLNMLNFHRNIGKEEELQQQDELGLLRYMEPGGGGNLLEPFVPKTEPAPKGPFDTSGQGGAPDAFLQRYTAEKVLRMVKMFRGHPSLMVYVVQNEVDPNVANPKVWYILRAMHELDPSRAVVAKSGIPPVHEAWLEPYSQTAHYDDGTGYSGWRDEHTVGGPGVWVDELYQDPTHYTHRLDDPREINDWGEMLGSPSADHHDLMVRQIMAAGGDSYDLTDHQEIDAAYNGFLDKAHFRGAFPTTEKLYDDIGAKAYQFWGRVIESARLSDSNDILTISGWETTAIENHSGLVDNLRNPKGDPKLLAPHLAPLLPVVRPRGTIHRPGEPVLLDLYLLNETGHAATGTLELTLIAPDGRRTGLGAWPAPRYVQDHFVYPVQMGVVIPSLKTEGVYRVSFDLKGPSPAANSETIEVLNPVPAHLPETRIGVSGESAGMLKRLADLPHVHAEPWRLGVSYDLLIAPQTSHGSIVRLNDGSPVANTEDDTLYRASLRGGSNSFTVHIGGLPEGKARVSLYFADLSEGLPHRHDFDIEINHQVVARNFDIVTAAGGGSTAVIKTFTVDTVQGAIDFGPGHVSGSGEALFNAVKIEAGGQTFAYVLGGEQYTDKTGLVWKPYLPPSQDLPGALLDEVRAGTPVLIAAPSESTGGTAASLLSAAGAFHFNGTIPTERAAWMGDWIFVRQSPLFDGLPQNEVMKGDYQPVLRGAYGLQVEGPGVDIWAGYGRDHGRSLGATIFTAKLGKGTVLFDGLAGAAPLVEQRLLADAIAYLRSQPKQ
jgi:hypothetical protein